MSIIVASSTETHKEPTPAIAGSTPSVPQPGVSNPDGHFTAQQIEEAKRLGQELASHGAVNEALERAVEAVDKATEGYLMSVEHREVIRGAIRGLKVAVVSILVLIVGLSLVACGAKAQDGRVDLWAGVKKDVGPVATLVANQAFVSLSDPRIEQAYAKLRVDYETYKSLKEAERAASTALEGLASKQALGEAVTQDEIDAVVSSLVRPFIKLLYSKVGGSAVIVEDAPKK